MGKIFLILGILLAFLLSKVHAQTVWSAEDCINYAIQHNLNIEKSKLQNEINKGTYNQSIRDLLPSAGLSAGSGIYFGKSVDPTTYEFVDKQFFSANYSVWTSVDLFNGFTKFNTISFKRLSYLAGIENSKQQKNEVAFKVIEDYFDVLFYQGLLGIAQKQKELSELNLKRAKVNFETGLGSKSDLLEMESRLASEELQVVQTQNSLSAALLSLKQTMNFNGKEALNLNDKVGINDLSAIQEGETDTVFHQALVYNPQLKAVEYKESAARKYLSISKGHLLPSLSMSGGYSSNYASAKGDENTASLSDQFKLNASQSISVSLQIPIFYNWGRQTDVRIAKLQYLQAKAEFDLAKQQLYQEIEKNFNDLASLSAEYTQTVKQFESSTLAFEAAGKKLEQGLIDIISYYNSKNVMAQAESNVLRTKLQYELKKRTISFFIGTPIYSETNEK
jgi:outer membrane protein